jgi:hypothetical protein
LCAGGLEVQFTSIKASGFNRKATRGIKPRGGFFISDRGFIGTARLHFANNFFIKRKYSQAGLEF